MSQVTLSSSPAPAPADQKPLSPGTRVLSNTFLARLIASFSDNRCGDVNRTLRDASGHVMMQRFPQFILAQRESENALATACGQNPNVDSGELLKWADAIHKECLDTIVNGDIGPKPNDDYDKARALQARTRELWQRFTTNYFNPLRERLDRNKPETRHELFRACACLFDIKNQVHFIPHPQTKAAGKNERLGKTIARLTTYMAQESLAERIRLVFWGRLSPETMASKFRDLSNNQRHAVRCDNRLIQQFHACAERNQRSYSYEQFVAFEMLAIEGEESTKRNMENFRHGVWNAVTKFDLHLSYSSFLDEPGNQLLFDQVQTLLLGDVNLNDSAVMGHLRKFGNLTTLDIRCNNPNAALTDLTDELASFPSLRCLILEGHAFSKIPDVLAKMPNLLILDLWNNRVQIEELPEDFTRHYLGGWSSLALDQLRDLATAVRFITNGPPGPNGVILDKLSNYHTLCLSPDRFRRIPFSLWFREHFSIPYIPSLAFGALLGATGVGNRVMQIIFTGTPVRYNDVVDFLLLLPFALLTFALNLPIFIANVIINRVIEPILSWVRESCCGCDPMVEL